MIVPASRSARSSARADLPLAVGPAMSASLGRSEGCNVDIATLIASNGDLSSADIDMARDALAGVGAMPGEAVWIDEGIAADLPFGRTDRANARAALEGLLPGVDIVIQRAAGRSKKL